MSAPYFSETEEIMNNALPPREPWAPLHEGEWLAVALSSFMW